MGSKEETLLAKRFVDLSRQAQQKNIVLFSDFLNLNELNIFRQQSSELYSDFELYGGYELSERQMIAFLPDALCYDWNFPICCLEITPSNARFAENLSHRDVLGSLMSLGIERSMLGDILVDETLIYAFCQEKIAGYLMENLGRIRHTAVLAKQVMPKDLKIEPKKESAQGIISSNRLDGVIACICRVSRSQASQWVHSGRIFINNRVTLQAAYECKPMDIISVRSLGRFRFLGHSGETRKGRLKIQFEKYL